MMDTVESGLIFHEELYALKTKVLVVIGTPWTSLRDDEQLLLGKILGAVKQTLAGVQVVERPVFSVRDFTAFAPEFIISFGSDFQESPKMYEVITAEKCFVLTADALQQLDEAKKKSLWSALKQMFKS